MAENEPSLIAQTIQDQFKDAVVEDTGVAGVFEGATVTTDAEKQAAAAAQAEAAKTAEAAKVEAEKIAAQAATAAAEKTETQPPEDKLAAEAAEAAKNKVPTIDELIAEKTGGKYKTWEEAQKALEAERDEFADDEVRKINELKKQGVKIDENFWKIQSTDYGKMTDPDQILAEAMRLKDPGISDEEIRFEIESKYRRNEWSEEGEAKNEVEKAMSRKMQRDAEREREWLIENKAKLTVTPSQDPAKAIADRAKAEDAQRAWEKSVEVAAKALDKFDYKIGEESWEYKPDKATAEHVATLAKAIGNNSKAFFDDYVKDNKFDLQRFAQELTKGREFDKAVKGAFEQGISSGAKKEFERLKNINYTPASTATSADNKPQTFNDQLAQGIIEANKPKN